MAQEVNIALSVPLGKSLHEVKEEILIAASRYHAQDSTVVSLDVLQNLVRVKSSSRELIDFLSKTYPVTPPR